MSPSVIVARREFRSYFDSPIAYVVIGLSLAIVGVFVFKDFWTANRATITPLFTYLPWALVLLIVPALTMRLLSEERRSGTMELLITMPVRDHEVVLGKFFSTLSLVGILLLLTAPYPLLVGRLGNLDWGPIWVGYVGVILMASACIAIGLFFSSLTENQIIAFMLTFVVLLGLWTVDYLGGAVGGALGDVFAFMSFQRRLTPFGRGLLDMRNIVYFISVATFFLMLTVRSLESRKWK